MSRSLLIKRLKELQQMTVVWIVAMPGRVPPQEPGVVCCVLGTPAFARWGVTEPNVMYLVRLEGGTMPSTPGAAAGGKSCSAWPRPCVHGQVVKDTRRWTRQC
jgi:hypothetical protein